MDLDLGSLNPTRQRFPRPMKSICKWNKNHGIHETNTLNCSDKTHNCPLFVGYWNKGGNHNPNTQIQNMNKFNVLYVVLWLEPNTLLSSLPFVASLSTHGLRIKRLDLGWATIVVVIAMTCTWFKILNNVSSCQSFIFILYTTHITCLYYTCKRSRYATSFHCVTPYGNSHYVHNLM